MTVHFKSLKAWPPEQPATPVGRRKPGLFTADYLARLNLLESEMTAVSAKDAILTAFIPKNQIRADGWPLSSAKAAGPGLILSFTSNGQPREFAADHYDDWKDNLYAVAKTLEALRGINRWGGASSGKQYAGFSPVLAPDAQPMPASFASSQSAAVFLADHAEGWSAGQILNNSLVLKSAYNAASIKLHPDTGGTHEGFVQLQQAKDLLERHHHQR